MKIIANPSPSTAPDKLDAITSMETPKRAGLLLFALVFGVFGLWASIAPLDGAAFAPGQVTVRSYKKIVQHLEGGIVAQIQVRNGDVVNRGDTLLILDDTQARADLETANARYIGLKVREARLIAERDQFDEVRFPAELSRTDSRVAEEMDAQVSIFQARKAANEGSIEILEQRIEQLQSQLEGMRAVREAKLLLANSFEEELADTRTLLEQGFSDINRLRTAERSYASYSGEAAELAANISATEVRIGEARLEIIQQRSEFRNTVVSELGDTQTALKDVAERITALEDVVRRTRVVSPESGIVNGMQVHTEGGVIGPGSPIAEIVPESDELIIEASVSPMDIDRVSIGQEARIRFSTFGSRAPTIFGSLLSLSADALNDERTGGSFYLARIQVNPDSMEELGDLALMPGMPAEVYINTGSRTFMQYLFKPLSNAAARSFNED